MMNTYYYTDKTRPSQATKAARHKADREGQEWLEEALRMEAGSTSTPPPNQLAQMPTGEESWLELKAENVQEVEEGIMLRGTQNETGKCQVI